MLKLGKNQDGGPGRLQPLVRHALFSPRRDSNPAAGLAPSTFLPGVLEPLLVGVCLLPLFVRRAGADQVHIGTEVFAARARSFADTVRGQAKIIRLERRGGLLVFLGEVSTP